MAEDNFVLPDEFKDSPVLKDAASVADLCKKVVEKESFIGKLQSERAMPSETDGDDVWNQYIGKMKDVASKEKWDGVENPLATVFKDKGITTRQAKPVLDFLKSEQEKKFDKTDFDVKKTAAFKDKPDALKSVEAILDQLSDENKQNIAALDNDGLLKAYHALAEVAEKMAIKEATAAPASTATGSGTFAAFNADSSVNKENFSKFLDEMWAVKSGPNAEAERDAIRKKYGVGK